MKKLTFAILVTLSISAYAQSHYVQPYVTKDGTFVQGHYQTNPNGTRADNYSTQGNTNPYTGQQGTGTPYPAYGGAITPAMTPAIPAQPQCSYTTSGKYVCR